MSRIVEFINPNPFSVQLIGPDKKIIHVPRHTKVVLSEWYIPKYTPKYLKVVRIIDQPDNTPKPATKAIKAEKSTKTNRTIIRPKNKPLLPIAQRPQIRTRSNKISNSSIVKLRNGKIIGRKAKGDPAVTFKLAASSNTYPISNNIGVGILSYNRLASLQRLINSIRMYTDLSRTTIFVSDESSLPEVKEWLHKQSDIVTISNQTRLGVAGNSNRLLRCLSRFKYKLLLNDDVEIKCKGWDAFYFNAMVHSGIHHFCFRQSGVYGAKPDDGTKSDHGIVINTINNKPQGSVMAFDQLAFETIGYFDESFGLYGMEHVDWSNRLSSSGIQLPGFHDVVGADGYFKIWAEKSAVEDRVNHLQASRELYNKLTTTARKFVNPTDASLVPSISYVIPCRNITERNNSIPTIVANIRAQHFPNIEIILVEQDWQSRISHDQFKPYCYLLAQSLLASQPFNKSMAFNLGVMAATNAGLVLHDADIMVPANYTTKIYETLRNFDSCHLGKQVVYLTREATIDVNNTYQITPQKQCDRAVDYFEGGSLAVRKSSYINIGGFDEGFVGYGCEDNEFYERLQARTNLKDDRTVTMIHLWHDRVGDWQTHHKTNRNYLNESQNKYNIDERCKMLHERLIKKYHRG